MNNDEAIAWDMLRAAKRVEEFTSGLAYADFAADELRQSAVLHQIILMGEAAKRLSQEFRTRHARIPWPQIAGMRDRCVHGYDAIDLPIVWEVVQTHAPKLAADLVAILPQPPSNTE